MKNANDIYEMLKTLSEEPNFDTFEASPNFHCFTELCEEFGFRLEDFGSYGDLFEALVLEAEKRGVDVSDIEC